MKRFVLNILVFGIIGFAIVFLVIFFIVLKANGNTDPYFIRFSTPPSTSLIIGTSIAAHGVQPVVLNKILERNDIFNYAFSVDHSPFGDIYLKSIQKKLDKNTQNGIFVVTVDPWSISSQCEDPNNEKQFRELDLCLAKLPFVNLNPNIFYFLNFYDKRIIDILKTKEEKSSIYLHEDGWLEISIPMDSTIVSERTKNKVIEYETTKTPYYKYSSLRYDYLCKTIEYLQEHGKVFLVRLPVSPALSDIGDALMPNFNDLMTSLSESKNIPYLDFTPENHLYTYIDGNHLWKDSGRIVSQKIGEWIKGKMVSQDSPKN